MPRFRLVFFGTPEFAVPSLQALFDGPDLVVGVVCQPDRPAGRGQRLQPPPVKQAALARGVPVVQPEKIRTPEFLAALQAWQPDLSIVAAYGRILPQAILDVPRLGCLNVHASLLPKYRGAAPIQWAILRGEAVTGVTIMRMNARMDEGALLLQRSTRIGDDETYGDLQARLAVIGAAALTEALAALHAGRLADQPQDHAAATLAPMIEKENGRIDWAAPAESIARQVRAFNPWPSAFTWLDGKRLKIHRARALDRPAGAIPGTIVGGGEAILVATGAGMLAIEELQLEGRNRLKAAEFMRSGVVPVGVRLGEDRPAAG